MLASEVPVIYDTVTLHIFAEMNRLDLLVQLFGHKPEPRWAEEVHNEVVKGKGHVDSLTRSNRILEAPWLGSPEAPKDVALVLKIQAALATPNGGADKNLGEAESMVLAIELGGIFVSDDKAAYDLARKRSDLGAGRVMDACAILTAAQNASLMTAQGVKEFHIAVAPKRSMRCHCQY